MMKKDKKNKCIALTMKHSLNLMKFLKYVIEFEWGVF